MADFESYYHSKRRTVARQWANAGERRKVDLGDKCLHPKLEELARWKKLQLADYQHYKLQNDRRNRAAAIL